MARAQAEIGRCFVNGLGRAARDTDLASKWLMLSAKAGDPLGQRLLGDYLISNGEGGAPDHAPYAEGGMPAPRGKLGEAETRRTCCRGY